MPTVHVVINWPDGTPSLPEAACARVTVEDVSYADAPARVLGETMVRELTVATSVDATVDVGAVDARSDITVRVHVSRSGAMPTRVAPGDLLTTQSYPVLTHGHGSTVVVVPQIIAG